MQLSSKKIFLSNFGPRQLDVGLLLLRLIVGLSIFSKHGLRILLGFHTMLAHFPDPIGVGRAPSFLVAMLSDVFCSLLVVFGLCTRWASLLTAFNVFMAWAFVHHFAFFASSGGDHGELCVLYIAVNLALFFTGAGRISLDDLIFRSKGSE